MVVVVWCRQEAEAQTLSSEAVQAACSAAVLAAAFCLPASTAPCSRNGRRIPQGEWLWGKMLVTERGILPSKVWLVLLVKLLKLSPPDLV